MIMIEDEDNSIDIEEDRKYTQKSKADPMIMIEDEDGAIVLRTTTFLRLFDLGRPDLFSPNPKRKNGLCGSGAQFRRHFSAPTFRDAPLCS